MSLPIDGSAKIQKAWKEITGEEYEHYHFWLTVGMAIHFESSLKSELGLGFQLYLEWSKQDKDFFISEEDVYKKWTSFSSSSSNPVTFKTIEGLLPYLTFNWVHFNSKTGKVDMTSLENHKVFLNYYNIQAHEWPGVGYFISAEKEVLNKYFIRSTKTVSSVGLPIHNGLVFGLGGPWTVDTLDIPLARLAQNEAGWRGKHSSYSSDLVKVLIQKSQPLNPVYRWLNSDITDLPETLIEEDHIDNSEIKSLSTFNNVMSAFSFPSGKGVNEELYKKMLYCMFMQIARLMDLDSLNKPNEGMVILIGPENCRKTSFFRWLFPSSLSKLVVQWMENLTSDKNKRDMGRALAGAGVFLLDECDAVLKGDEIASWLKAILTSNVVDYTEIYGKSRVSHARTALLAGTTNYKNLWLSSTGNRRMWLIEVDYIHMEYLTNSISRYWLYKSFFNEYKKQVSLGKTPWIMDPNDAHTIAVSNATKAIKSSLLLDLQELFDVDPKSPIREIPMDIDDLITLIGNPQKRPHPHLFSTSTVKNLLKINGFESKQVNNTSALHRSLAQLSYEFTGVKNAVLPSPRGKASYTYTEGQLLFNGRFLWVLPQLRKNEE